MIRILAAFILALAITAPAFAQTPQPRPRIQLPDPLNLRGDAAVTDDKENRDILGALEKELLPDLKYALAIAKAQDNQLTGGCWTAWIAIIEARQKATTDEQGQPIPMPDPALITRFQKLVDIRNALQPDSKFMIACSPVANMIKSDIRKFIGVILTGGVGLAAMGIGL